PCYEKHAEGREMKIVEVRALYGRHRQIRRNEYDPTPRAHARSPQKKNWHGCERHYGRLDPEQRLRAGCNRVEGQQHPQTKLSVHFERAPILQITLNGGGSKRVAMKCVEEKIIKLGQIRTHRRHLQVADVGERADA